MPHGTYWPYTNTSVEYGGAPKQAWRKPCNIGRIQIRVWSMAQRPKQAWRNPCDIGRIQIRVWSMAGPEASMAESYWSYTNTSVEYGAAPKQAWRNPIGRIQIRVWSMARPRIPSRPEASMAESL
jgi:hypothetical protein